MQNFNLIWERFEAATEEEVDEQVEQWRGGRELMREYQLGGFKIAKKSKPLPVVLWVGVKDH